MSHNEQESRKGTIRELHPMEADAVSGGVVHMTSSYPGIPPQPSPTNPNNQG